MGFLTEDPTWVYVLLLVGLGVAVIFFLRSQRVIHLAAIPILLLLAALVWLIDYAIETDREQVERKVQELADAVDAADYAKLEGLISDRFYTPLFTSKRNLIEQAKRYLEPGAKRQTSIWQVETRWGTSGKTIILDGNVAASGQYGNYNVEGWFGRIEFTFMQDADGQWRIAKFVVTDSQGSEVSLRR